MATFMKETGTLPADWEPCRIMLMILLSDKETADSACDSFPVEFVKEHMTPAHVSHQYWSGRGE